MIKKTNDFERSINEGTSYWNCLKGVDLRRTEIVCLTWSIQAAAGGTFLGFSTYFYQSAGLDSKDAFNLTFAQYALGGVGTILSWTLMSYFGRRTLHLSGLAIVSDISHKHLATRTDLLCPALPALHHHRLLRYRSSVEHRLPLGHRLSAARLHVHLRLHHRAGHLLFGRRDSIN